MLNKKLLITGANGLLGRECLTLLSNEYEVHAIVHSKPKYKLEQVHYHIIDFSNFWSFDDLPSDFDTIIHLAQSAHFREFPERASDIFKVNIETTARLLDFAHKNGVKKFLYASSGGVYGSGANPFNENTQISTFGNLGYYLGSKLCGEVLVNNYSNLMNVFVLRPFFMYGAGQNKSMLIPRLVETIQNNKPIILHGKQGIRINPIHVSDAANTIKGLLYTDKSLTINIAGSKILSIKDIANIIGNNLKIRPEFTIIEAEANDLIADISLMKSLKLEPKINFEQAIENLILQF
jgi:UDP-glucose 4-epimerase